LNQTAIVNINRRKVPLQYFAGAPNRDRIALISMEAAVVAALLHSSEIILKEFSMVITQRNVLWYLFLALVAVGCGSSAADMAAKKEGVTPRQVSRCDTRLCFLGLGSEILDKKENSDGSLTEIYRVKRARGSTIRSFAHGVLSFATLGIWNIVGTPIEGFLSSEEFIVFRVFYDTNEKAKKVEIQG